MSTNISENKPSACMVMAVLMLTLTGCGQRGTQSIPDPVAGQPLVVAHLDGTGDICLCNNGPVPIYVLGDDTDHGFHVNVGVTLMLDGEEREISVLDIYKKPRNATIPPNGNLHVRIGAASTVLGADIHGKKVQAQLRYRTSLDPATDSFVAETNILAVNDNVIGMRTIDVVYSLRARAFTPASIDMTVDPDETPDMPLRVMVVNDLDRDVMIQANRYNWVIAERWVYSRNGKIVNDDFGKADVVSFDFYDYRLLTHGNLRSRFDEDRLVKRINLSFQDLRQIEFTTTVDFAMPGSSPDRNERVRGSLRGIIHIVKKGAPPTEGK